MRLSAIVLAFAGCSAPIPVYARDDAMELAQDAADRWGVPIEFVARAEAVITYRIGEQVVIDGKDVCGEALVRTCRAVLWSCPNYRHAVHEFGHALGLDHVRDPRNYMDPAPGPTAYRLEGWQLDHAQRRADRLAICPPAFD